MAADRRVPLEIMRPAKRPDPVAATGGRGAGGAQAADPGSPAAPSLAAREKPDAGSTRPQGPRRVHAGTRPDPSVEPEGSPSGEEAPGPPWSAILGWDWQRPVVLRVPRGVAAAGVLAAMALLVVTYRVGYRLGDAAGAQRAQEAEASTRLVGRPAPVREGATIGPGAGPAEGSALVGGRGRVITPAQADPRMDGLNYLILARYPEVDARALAAFLSNAGVDVGIVPSDNTRLFHVIALPGIPPGAGDRMDDLLARMRSLGRDWKREGGGDDLRSMYFAKFTG